MDCIYVSLFTPDPVPAVRPKPPKFAVVPVPRPRPLVPSPVLPSPVLPSPVDVDPSFPRPVPHPPVPLDPGTLLKVEPVDGLPSPVALLERPVPDQLLPCEAVPPNLVLPTPLLDGHRLPRFVLPGLELPRLVLPIAVLAPPKPTFIPLVAGLFNPVEPVLEVDPGL